MIDIEQALTPSQAARELGLSRERVGQMVRSGQLTAIRTGLGYLVDRGSVERERERRALVQGGTAA